VFGRKRSRLHGRSSKAKTAGGGKKGRGRKKRSQGGEGKIKRKEGRNYLTVDFYHMHHQNGSCGIRKVKKRTY